MSVPYLSLAFVAGCLAPLVFRWLLRLGETIFAAPVTAETRRTPRNDEPCECSWCLDQKARAKLDPHVAKYLPDPATVKTPSMITLDCAVCSFSIPLPSEPETALRSGWIMKENPIRWYCCRSCANAGSVVRS